jgi:hypothetical protein
MPNCQMSCIAHGAFSHLGTISLACYARRNLAVFRARVWHTEIFGVSEVGMSNRWRGNEKASKLEIAKAE